jgi:hypothetical protein
LWRADLQRLRGVLLTAIGADETQIEASFCEAIRTAREQSRFRWRDVGKQATQSTAAKRVQTLHKLISQTRRL